MRDKDKRKKERSPLNGEDPTAVVVLLASLSVRSRYVCRAGWMLMLSSEARVF